jgi:hypothetical protein
MRTSGFGVVVGSIAGIVLCILIGCASNSGIKKSDWEKILDEIPWENRMTGSVVGDENNLPDDIFSVLYRHRYQYVNSSHKILRQQDGREITESIYELKRENASYDPNDDTFVFIGEFYPSESNIWLVFSKDENYELFIGPDGMDKKEYKFIRVNGRVE